MLCFGAHFGGKPQNFEPKHSRFSQAKERFFFKKKPGGGERSIFLFEILILKKQQQIRRIQSQRGDSTCNHTDNHLHTHARGYQTLNLSR